MLDDSTTVKEWLCRGYRGKPPHPAAWNFVTKKLEIVRHHIVKTRSLSQLGLDKVPGRVTRMDRRSDRITIASTRLALRAVTRKNLFTFEPHLPERRHFPSSLLGTNSWYTRLSIMVPAFLHRLLQCLYCLATTTTTTTSNTTTNTPTTESRTTTTTTTITTTIPHHCTSSPWLFASMPFLPSNNNNNCRCCYYYY